MLRRVLLVECFQDSSAVPIFLTFYGILEKTCTLSVQGHLAFTPIRLSSQPHFPQIFPVSCQSSVFVTHKPLKLSSHDLEWEMESLFSLPQDEYGESHSSLMNFFTPSLPSPDKSGLLYIRRRGVRSYDDKLVLYYILKSQG